MSVWRVAQRGLAAVALVFLSPVVAVLAIAVRGSSPGPAFYRAVRVSRGRPFTMLKLRTMLTDHPGPPVTTAEDPRVTRFGRLLRQTKLDELPQLWNVVRGDMLLVGPRPEDPRYVDLSDSVHRLVFGTAPGITGPAAIAFRDEQRMLAAEALDIALGAGRSAPSASDVDRAYRERVLPQKLALDVAYIRTRSVRGDLRILGRTAAALFGR